MFGHPVLPEALMALLRREAPKFFELAEVVGKWVWIQFSDKQPPTVTGVLSELGFHWNRKRQSWQHPCRLFPDQRAPFDPRQKYGSYFAADLKPALTRRNHPEYAICFTSP
jgi:hypothetical protein